MAKSQWVFAHNIELPPHRFPTGRWPIAPRTTSTSPRLGLYTRPTPPDMAIQTVPLPGVWCFPSDGEIRRPGACYGLQGSERDGRSSWMDHEYLMKVLAQ